jgi:long-chain acyl-CoA synthetase
MEIVPSILIAILNTPYRDFSKEQVNSMKFIGCGSAFLPQNLQDAFQERFGIPVANLYGLSETGATHFDDPFVKGRETGSIGKPFDIVEAIIFDENGKEVQNNIVGEIGIKGPGLLKGYLNNQKLYEECFNKGFFMTGDLCRKDNKGNYYYMDRKKDLIIKGGVNIVPSQIEEVLQSHTAVQEAAVIGKPDILLGETIKCYLVSKNGSKPDIKELKSYCKEKLGDFKTPSKFEIIESLPKGPSGKILKRDLRLKD